MKITRFLLSALMVLVSVPLLLGYFGLVHQSFDAVSGFRLHLASGLVLLGILVLLFRGYAWGSLSLFTGLLVLAFHLPQLGINFRTAPQAGAGGPVYRLLLANLRFDNVTTKEFVRLVGETNPDVIALNENSSVWTGTVEALRPLYPHQLVCSPSNRIGGVAILSRRPFADAKTGTCSNRGLLAFQDIDLGGRIVTVGVTHLAWPWPFEQSLQLTGMREDMRTAGRQKTPLIFAGDLNAANWSHTANRIAAFLKADAVTIPGGTWLYHTLPQKWIARAGLPLDSVFVRGVAVGSAGTLSPFGSDHLPVLLEFSLPGE